jgi:hypothetical protein
MKSRALGPPNARFIVERAAVGKNAAPIAEANTLNTTKS